MEGDKPLIVITGVTGYLGAHTCLLFLKDGSFRVRGTVRNKDNAERVDPLKAAFGDLFEQLELVNADLNDQASIAAACEGATMIIHTASPFALKDSTDEQDYIKPAVDGTMAVMNAAAASGVKRVVITSSVVTLVDCGKEKPAHYDANDWSIPENQSPYSKSKTLAEKAAWDFLKTPEGSNITLVTILPAFIVGPNLAPSEGGTVQYLTMFKTKGKEAP